MAMDEVQTPKAPPPSSKTYYPNHRSPPTTFSYTSSESVMRENIENAEAIIKKWDPNTPSLEKFMSLFLERRNEAHEFISRVDGLRKAMHFLLAQRCSNHHLVLANNLMKIAMLRLEKEFLQVLLARREYLNPKPISSIESGSRSVSSGKTSSMSLGKDSDEGADDCIDVGCDGNDQTTKIERSMADLKIIAKSMISSGYSKECGRVYRVTRKLIVDDELNRLGLRSYNQSLINRMNEDVLEQHVTKWIHMAKLAVRAVFQGERFLCDHVFDLSETIKQACIAHIMMEGATNLFKFAEMVAKSKRSPDKIFIMMNLFEGISKIWPEIESIFSYESLSPIKIQALSSMHKLSDSAQTILAEFVSSIQKNSSKTPVPGGGIHPLTYSVMDYVCLLADHSGPLSDILADEEDTATAAQSPFPESYFDTTSPTSGVASRLAWIILVLLCKIDSKAELYKGRGLSYLFLANNLQFIVDKVAASSLKLLLGKDWISNLQRKVKLYAAKYETISWADVLSSLPPASQSEATEAFESPHKIKQQFRRFSSAFEAAYRKQSSYVVPNPKLREVIKASIAGKLVPAYREFYHRYLVILSEAKNFEALVKYSPDNLGNYLSELFHRSPVSVSQDSSPSSSPSSSSSFESKLPGCL